ncbi:hypothetical protein XA68_12587 [Ophiocordyceps unilateralis]|uniref:Uncharacterized protein n=1 Tax=Ophiocordyceps unilateralis TaxID=268505 RepID=A0A2A9PCQ8_OPHUN|nr:hypothetical protein XA68_12587 [Ophiocordyceps unilateralis]
MIRTRHPLAATTHPCEAHMRVTTSPQFCVIPVRKDWADKLGELRATSGEKREAICCICISPVDRLAARDQQVVNLWQLAIAQPRLPTSRYFLPQPPPFHKP